LFLGAALRDPEVFDAPDVVNCARKPSKLLAFGGGAHFCLGIHLAQVATEAALEALLPVLSALRHADSSRQWIRSIHMRGLRALPLRLGKTV
jgi:unspecific monooxygenase